MKDKVKTSIEIEFDKAQEQFSKIFQNTPSLPEDSFSFKFQKGRSLVRLSIPGVTESEILKSLNIMKSHIENIRILSFEEGHYSFQALNKNIFNTENLLNNFRLDFFSLINSYLEISKTGNFSQEELNTALSIIELFNRDISFDPAARLRALGASIISGGGSSWDLFAGYSDVKQRIKETILLPLSNPEIYTSIAEITRRVPESNRPTAVLFEGPPGVGKTTAAKIIAEEAAIPLIYIPVESIMSKWYGQSSQNLSEIFDLCDIMGGTILFLDEIDSLAGSREQNMFEATRRVLSVLLRKLDGIDSSGKTITIGATNRLEDLDSALISRFDQIIKFPFPDKKERAAIFKSYAKHLSNDSCEKLAEKSENMSGRNIKDICEMAERRWARKIIIKKLEVTPPETDYYAQSIQIWKNSSLTGMTTKEN